MRLIALAVALVACGGKPLPPPPPPPPPVFVAPPPEPNAQQKAAAEAIAHFFTLLTRESASPGDPELLREAAIEAMVPRGWKAKPIVWTNNIEQDAAVLRTAVHTLALRGELPVDAVHRVARAMTFAVNDIHTFAMSTTSLQALYAIIGGGPVVQVGMLYHKLDDGRWAVSDLIAGGAAVTAGVQRGDILVSIDGTPIVRGLLDFASLMGVAEGAEAKLVVERAGKNEELTLQLVAITQPIVEWRVLPGNIGYLRLFACTQSDDATKDAGKLVAAALAQLDQKRTKKLVLDLRGNVGGFPFDVASLLVAADPLMLAINADGADSPVPRTAVAASKTKRTIVVVVNELTASGGEMIALALRDHANAKLVGRPTAGGLTFPTIEKHKAATDLAVSYPLSRVASANTKAPLDGNRLVPDIAAPNPTAEDYIARNDPQLAAAIKTLR